MTLCKIFRGRLTKFHGSGYDESLEVVLRVLSWNEDPNQSGRFDFSLKVVFIATFCSLILHTVIVFLAVKRPIFMRSMDATDHAISVELKPSQLMPVVETLQKEAEEAPEDAKFASDRNLKSDKDVSPERAPMNIPRAGGGAGGKARAEASQKAAQQKKPIFSLSQAEILKDKNFKQETLTAGPRGAASAGFQERLDKGTELKLNARQFDYGNYINRMRNKLAQRWEPQKTIIPSMYSQRVVRIDVGVVLNGLGEIVELRTLESSRFPRYDDEAIRALREAAPYPNPPKSLIQDDGLVYMPWTFVLTMDAWGAVKGVE